MRKYLLILLLSIFCGGFTLSKGEQIRFQKISVEKGLSQSSVHAILQDSEGFLWFGTQDGLNRYDGYSFKIFKPSLNDTTSISDNWITDLAEDNDGNIWIATYGGGFNKFDKKTNKFTRFTQNQINSRLLPSNIINSIYFDKKENLWIGTKEGLCRLNIKENKLYNFNQNELKKNIIKVISDNENNLWLATDSIGIVKFNESKNQISVFNEKKKDEFYFKGINVFTLLADSKRNIWAASGKGLSIKKNGEKGFKRFEIFDKNEKLSKIQINNIFEDENNIYWLGTEGSGIIKLNLANNHIEVFENNPYVENSLSDNQVLTAIKDRSGIIWFGTYGGGVSKFDKKKNRFKLFTKDILNKNSLDDGFIHAIADDNSGKVWIGTGKGLNILDPKSGKIFQNDLTQKLKKLLGEIRIMSVAFDNENNMWIGTWGAGLIKYNSSDNSIKQFKSDTENPNSLINNRVRTVYIDNNGKIWLGTLKGMSIFEPSNGKFTNYSKTDKSKSELGIVRFFTQDKNGIFWIGTETSGLIRFDENSNSFKHFLNDPENPKSISSDRIGAFLEDSKGRFWVATFGGGLNLFDRENETFEHFTNANGFFDNVVYGILEDKNENLWISTNSGLVKFNTKDYSIKSFTILDGLQSNEFNGGAFHKTESGEMYFGGIKGLNSFFPDNFVMNNVAPSIVLTEFKVFDKQTVFDKSLNHLEKIELPYSKNFISFEFAALDFSTSELNQYAYKLEGFDKEWIQCGTRRYVSYTNLEPGEYTFRVIGANNDGTWNTEGASIKLNIVPPFYKTWLFKLILIGTILIGWVVIYEIRVNTVQKQKEKLERLVDSRTEELKNKKEELQNINNEQSVILKKLSESEIALKELNSNKDKLFSIIAHDLKSPFTSLLGFSELIVSEIDNLSKDQLKEYLGNIQGSLNNLLNLLNNLLQWSRVQTNSIEFTFRHIKLYEISEKVIALLKGNAIKKNIKIINQIDIFAVVFADSFTISLVIQNIISNAVKFTNPGGAIILSAEDSEDFVKVKISDNGVGMDKDSVKKIFARNEHHSTLGTAKETGTGLGLMLSKDFVEKNGGKIEVESEVGKGTTFSIYLPKNPVEFLS